MYALNFNNVITTTCSACLGLVFFLTPAAAQNAPTARSLSTTQNSLRGNVTFGDGWYSQENGGLRWTSRKATFQVNDLSEEYLHLMFYVPADQIKQLSKVQVEININGILVDRLEFLTAGHFFYTGAFPDLNYGSRQANIVLTTTSAFKPSGDARELGVGVITS